MAPLTPMRVLGTLLLVTGLALLSLPALAQETGKTSHVLVAKSQSGAFIWTDEAGTATNPPLVVPPNTQVTITIKQGEDDGIPHNIKVGTGETSRQVSALDDTLDYTFTSGTANVPYICAIHPDTMKGTVRVAGAPADGGDNDAPGVGVLGVLVALLGASLVALRRR